MEMENELYDEKLSMGEKIKCFFINPRRLFKSVKEKPIYIFPFLIALISSVAGVIVTYTVGKEAMIEQVTESLKGNPGADMAMNILTSPAMLVIGIISAVFGVFAALLVPALIYWILIKIFKGEIKISQMISVYAICYIATALGSILQVIYTVATKKTILQSTTTFSDLLINSLNIFSLWKMVLLVFGISAAANLSKKKSITIVLIMFVLALLFSYASLMFGQAAQNLQPKL
jgi:hypothetical protein